MSKETDTNVVDAEKASEVKNTKVETPTEFTSTLTYTLCNIKSLVPYTVCLQYGNDVIYLMPYSVIKGINKNKLKSRTNEFTFI